MDKNLETEYGARFIIDELGLHFSKRAIEIEIMCDSLGITYYSTNESNYVKHSDAYTLIRKCVQVHNITII